jgi:hypothetical protein
MKTFFNYLENRIPSRTRLTEGITGNVLTPTDLYDFYWLCSGFSYGQFNGAMEDSKDEQVARFYLQEIQNLYIKVFTELLAAQIEKYVKRGRIDMAQGKPAFDIMQLRNAPFHKKPSLIKYMMAQTFRSDMSRRNDRWDMIADYLVGLASTGSTSKICYFIDRINNSVHNTQTLVLDKLPNAAQLMVALDAVHHSGTPKEFASKVSPEVRRLMKNWTGPTREQYELRKTKEETKNRN